MFANCAITLKKILFGGLSYIMNNQMAQPSNNSIFDFVNSDALMVSRVSRPCEENGKRERGNASQIFYFLCKKSRMYA